MLRRDTRHLYGLDARVHGLMERGTARRCEARRGEARRDEARRVVFRGSHGSASTWIMPVPVRPTRTCPWNGWSRARLDASLRSERSSRLPAANGSAGISSDEFLTLLHRRGAARHGVVRSGPMLTSGVFRRCANAIRTKRCSVITHPSTLWRAFVILNISVWPRSIYSADEHRVAEIGPWDINYLRLYYGNLST